MILDHHGDILLEVPAVDRIEQHQPVDPLELAHASTGPALDGVPLEVDPLDATEQAETIAFDDELRDFPARD